MTPKDFSAITGLPVCGLPLFVNHGLHRDKRVLYSLLGDEAIACTSRRVPIYWLCRTYSDLKCVSTDDEDVVARAFILALLGATIFSTSKLDVDLDLLSLLTEIRTISRYNWGAAALAFLYNDMDDICRRNKCTIGGLWHSWEVWAREYFQIFPVLQPVTKERVFPATKKWNLLEKPDEDVSIRLEYYRIKLDIIFNSNVAWNPWGHDAQLPWYVAMSIDATRRRILLIGPNGGTWYLAERVLLQSIGRSDQVIPKDPPKSMLQPCRMKVSLNPLSILGESAHNLVTHVQRCQDDLNSQIKVPELDETFQAVTEEKHNVDIQQPKHTADGIWPVLGTGSFKRGRKIPFQCQTLHVPPTLKQVPVQTAVKMLQAVGGLQLVLVDFLHTAEQKLCDTAMTLATIRDEMVSEGLYFTTTDELDENNTCEAATNQTS